MDDEMFEALLSFREGRLPGDSVKNWGAICSTVGPLHLGIDYATDALDEARTEAAAIERARILTALEAIAPPDEMPRGLYDSLAARVEHRTRREHHAKVLAVISAEVK